MAKVNRGNMIGAWTFLIGVVLAIIFGLFGEINEVIAWILVLVGLIAGFLNIADDEAEPFLMSGAVLIIAAAFGSQTVEVIPILGSILNALLLIFVPATIIVAIRNVFGLARR